MVTGAKSARQSRSARAAASLGSLSTRTSYKAYFSPKELKPRWLRRRSASDPSGRRAQIPAWLRSRCSGVESLGILADHDAAGAGERAAREVEARWRAAGTEVRIFMWEKLGDINDALRQGAAMSSSPEEILAHLRMHEIPKG